MKLPVQGGLKEAKTPFQQFVYDKAQARLNDFGFPEKVC